MNDEGEESVNGAKKAHAMPALFCCLMFERYSSALRHCCVDTRRRPADVHGVASPCAIVTPYAGCRCQRADEAGARHVYRHVYYAPGACVDTGVADALLRYAKDAIARMLHGRRVAADSEIRRGAKSAIDYGITRRIGRQKASEVIQPLPARASARVLR